MTDFEENDMIVQVEKNLCIWYVRKDKWNAVKIDRELNYKFCQDISKIFWNVESRKLLKDLEEWNQIFHGISCER